MLSLEAGHRAFTIGRGSGILYGRLIPRSGLAFAPAGADRHLVDPVRLEELPEDDEDGKPDSDAALAAPPPAREAARSFRLQEPFTGLGGRVGREPASDPAD